jgi:RHS repeat-associated protein
MVALAEDKISPADLVDARNRRVGITINNGGLPGNIPNGTTDCIWFGWQAMEERNLFGGTGSTDTPIRQYVWGTYIDECIQLTTLATLGPQSLPAGYYYLLQDTLYRAMALTNSSGSVVEAYDTDAYGNTLIFTGPGADGTWFTDDDVQSSYGANEIIYCGYRYDPESETYYVRNRYYAPTLGRWLTRDPIGLAGGTNLYEYVGGVAVGAADPNGEVPFAVYSTQHYWCLGTLFAYCQGVCTCGVGVAYGGLPVTEPFVTTTMAAATEACCLATCDACALFDAGGAQPGAMSVCLTKAMSLAFAFSTTSCNCS